MDRKSIPSGSHVRIIADDDPNQNLLPEERFDRGLVGKVWFFIQSDSRDVPRPYCVSTTYDGAGSTIAWVHDIEEVGDNERENSLDWTEFNDLYRQYRKKASNHGPGPKWEREGSGKLLGRLVDARDALIWRGYVPMSHSSALRPESFCMATTPEEFVRNWKIGYRP